MIYSRLYAVLSLLIVALGFPFQQEIAAAEPSVAVPLWAKSIEGQLPKVSSALITEVEQLRSIVVANGAETVRMMNPATIEATKKFIALKDSSGQALVWLYVREPVLSIDVPPTKTNDPTVVQGLVDMKGEKRGDILRLVKDDPTLTQWLLPAVRARLRWMSAEIAAKRIKQTLSHAELSATYSYLYAQGTWDDVEAFERILAAASKEGIYILDPLKPPKLKDREATFHENHSWVQRYGRPLWKEQGQLLVSAKLIDQSVLSDVPLQNQNVSKIPPQSGASSKERQSRILSQQSSEPEATPLSIIVVLIVAACGLLWFLVKRRS